MWQYDGRPVKMARPGEPDGPNDPQDVLSNGQGVNFTLHSVGGYPIPAHFQPPTHSGSEVKQEYHISGVAGEPHTAAAAAYTPIGKYLRLSTVALLGCCFVLISFSLPIWIVPRLSLFVFSVEFIKTTVIL